MELFTSMSLYCKPINQTRWHKFWNKPSSIRNPASIKANSRQNVLLQRHFVKGDKLSDSIQNYMTAVPHTVGHDMPLEKAKEMMRQQLCHHLPVLNGGKLVGVVSDTDLRAAEKFSKKTDWLVENIMTDEPVVVSSTEDVFQVAMLMHQKKIGSVIVSGTPDSPWGIFTATDALRFFTQKRSQ